MTSNYSQDDVAMNEPIKSLKKKMKFKKFYIRRQLPEEIIPEEKKVAISIHETYRQYQTYSWKRDILPSLNFYFSLDSTPKDIHLLTFKIHLSLLATFEGLHDLPKQVQDEGLEEAYQKYVLNEVPTPLSYCRSGYWSLRAINATCRTARTATLLSATIV